jgi:microcystin-dependent protein
MSTPYLSEIRIFSFNFPPKGWAFCNGQLLPINQNQALFSLLGITYGGNGTTNFALPDLQDRTPLHMGTNVGTTYALGQRAGESAVTLTTAQMPAHTHSCSANKAAAGQTTPAGNYWGNGGQTIYADSANATMNPAAVATVGGSQPHQNMSPFLVLNFCIALQGIFPSRN